MKKPLRKMLSSPVDVALINSLKAIAWRRGLSMADILREAIRRYVETENGAQKNDA